jgi:hypothetical protein
MHENDVTFEVVFYLSISMSLLEHVNVVIKKRNVFLCIQNVLNCLDKNI